MSRRNYHEQKISDVFEERRRFYQGKMEETFNTVYLSGNVRAIGRFEDIILLLQERATAGTLETLAIGGTSKKEPAIATKEQSRKPLLTSKRYAAAIEQGMTNEQIRETYRMSSPYSLGGYARQLQARLSKSTGAPQPTESGEQTQ